MRGRRCGVFAPTPQPNRALHSLVLGSAFTSRTDIARRVAQGKPQAQPPTGDRPTPPRNLARGGDVRETGRRTRRVSGRDNLTRVTVSSVHATVGSPLVDVTRMSVVSVTVPRGSRGPPPGAIRHLGFARRSGRAPLIESFGASTALAACSVDDARGLRSADLTRRTAKAHASDRPSTPHAPAVSVALGSTWARSLHHESALAGSTCASKPIATRSPSGSLNQFFVLPSIQETEAKYHPRERQSRGKHGQGAGRAGAASGAHLRRVEKISVPPASAAHPKRGSVSRRLMFMFM